MQFIQASKFKAKCLALMDEVARSGTSLLITKNGKPVAKLRPHLQARAGSLIGLDKGRIKTLGDIVAPFAADDWNALRRSCSTRMSSYGQRATIANWVEKRVR